MRAKYGVVGAAINLTSRIGSCTVGDRSCSLGTGARALRCQPCRSARPGDYAQGVRGTLTIYEALAVAALYDVTLQQRAEDRHLRLSRCVLALR